VLVTVHEEAGTKVQARLDEAAIGKYAAYLTDDKRSNAANN
jgi:hypothetical protein